WALDALVALIPADVPHFQEIAIDGRVLAVSIGAALATGLGFGIVPALHASRSDLQDALKGAGRTVVQSHRRARATLLGSEIAVAMLLLAGAGLMLRSFARLSSVSPGFNPEGVLTAAIALPDSRYRENSEIIRFYRELLPRLDALPGAQAGAVAMPLPFS